MKKLLLLVITVVFSSTGIFAQHNLGFDGKNYYFTDRLLVVLQQNYFSENNNSVILENTLNKSLQTFAPKSITKMFNIKVKESNSGNFLNRVYLMEFSNKIDIKLFVSKIKKLKGIEAAEPYYLNESFYTPNDPSYAQQYALNKINAASAWDITKGSKNVIIGIIDTGVDWDHPDLATNIWTNPNEIPDNGIDDDNNGVIDDIRGWDFGGLVGVPDNNPMEDRADHGTLVAGCASAVTDNGIGISSIGFNSTIMPVKTSQDNIRTDTGKALITYGYEGILYAAQNGASVINCSWGNYAYSTINRAIIDYVVVVMNSCIVAAMGNDNLDATMYPANYPGVLSVASTSTDDTRSSFSNYGYGVDVCAPGTAIYSTWMNDTYTSASGTSLSSPIVAGLCALVKSKFPLYTALQIAEQVRTNCDDIYAVNSAYDKKLGRGRINAFNTLNNINSKSLRLYEYEITETENDGVFKPGENLKLTVHLLNYLAPLPLINVSLSTTSPYATITNNSFSASAIGMLEIFDNGNNLFSVDLATNIPANTIVDLVLNYSSTGYTDYEVIQIIVNPTFATQTTDNIEFTVTNKGTFGFNNYPDNSQGIGFKLFNSSNLLFEGGLLF
ncbi:MAG TPA: S8 family peptidase, partial [Melioribacteraceae bacterium]|nr:S8 family peptidase [Melioribacteraceae bacterium]